VKVLSLGWGVQSFTLAAMVALGDLPPIDAAIHADTTHESKLTYEFAERWVGWLKECGVKVATVISRDVQPIEGVVSQKTDIPAFTFNGKTKGQLRRQCTHQWKIVAIRRWLQANRNGEQIEQWIGISMDEALRMRPSDVKYVTHRWPLIEKEMSRKDCGKYLIAKGLEVPPKSACTFCPFHSTKEWQRLKSIPDDWREAITVDEKIRKARPPYELFVHPSCKPLEQVDLRTEQEKGQMSLWDEECSGLCGI
jgi:hypothetical protein